MRNGSNTAAYWSTGCVRLEIEFDLYLSTMHVSVMFLDRVLHKVTVPRNKLQLVAIACILIAAKSEETEEKVPTLPEMNRYAQWYVSHHA